MEQINRVELLGLVGNSRIQEVNGKRVARFTLATSSAYSDRSGGATIDTQWHNVNAWEGKGVTCLDKIGKGSRVHVWGRIRYSRYTGSDQNERFSAEIQANKVVVIESDDALQYEM